MATIGKLNAIISANSAKFNDGMKSAAASMSSLASPIKSLNGLLAGIGVGLSVAGITAFVKSSMDAIDTNAKLADRLGVTTESLAGMQLAADLAGVSNEELTGNMAKLEKNIYAAATEGGKSAEAFTRIGLSAQSLAAMTPDQQLRTIADAFKNIQNPAERAATAQELFGKSGQAMINVLMGGSASFAQAQKDVDAWGYSVSRVDAAQVEAANDAFTRLGYAVKGIGNQLAVALAPYIEYATNSLLGFIASGGGLRSVIGTGLEYVGKGIGVVADGWELLKLGYMALEVGAEMALEGILKGFGYTVQGIAWVAEGLQWWLELASKLPKWLGGGMATDAAAAMRENIDAMRKYGEETVKTFDGMSNESKEKLGKAWNQFLVAPPSERIESGFKNIKIKAVEAGKVVAAAAKPMKSAMVEAAEATKKAWEKSAKKIMDDVRKINETISGLKDDAATAGMSKIQKIGYDLKKLGASRNEINEAQKYGRQAEMGERAADLRKRIEDAMTPMEKYTKEIGSLTELFQQGKITKGEYAEGYKLARKDLEGAGPKEFTGMRMSDFVLGGGSGKKKTEVKVDKQDEVVKTLKEINRELRNNNKPVAVMQ